ncbi:uncharacterized protein METZ01_LOCUS279618 [marine metagenome]|uniref:Uncharacterized protein n=1 Tax=marine metagenome TaxID=408172 RepID=A0A382KPI3_9ZZZZ
MHRKRKEILYTVYHVLVDAAFPFTALRIITIKTGRLHKYEKGSLRKQ